VVTRPTPRRRRSPPCSRRCRSLGGAKAERLIQTLHVYLDQQGSLTKTAEALNLHRNAVAYRIKNAFAPLEVDPDNPDDLLLLQLACRARELS
jgi:DNA-binding PucR family transcriptional regulator